MKKLTQTYLTALRNHLKREESPDWDVPRGLGQRAVTLGLDTLDMARLHEESLKVLLLPPQSACRNSRLVQRAGAFFTEVITPIESTHRGAREANAQLKTTIEALTQRTVELARVNEKLLQEIAQRKIVEDSLRISEQTSSQLLAKSRQMQDELRLLSRRLLSVQEEERKSISRELHDVVAQTLNGINLRLVALKAKTKASAKDVHQSIAITQRLVKKSVETVHRFARDLRPSVLDDLGLIPALRSYIKGFITQTGIPVSLTAFAGVEKLNGASRTALYRIVQEALTNVAKHSKASHAKVSIVDHNNKMISLEIRDNGRGFQVADVIFTKKSKRLGLLGMRERTEMIGGTFRVDSLPGRETIVRVEIPPNNTSTKKGRTS